MRFVETAGTVLGLAAALARGHMEMTSPPPLRSKHNPNTPPGMQDYSMTAPLSASGADFPCKGYLDLLGQPAARPVASWAPGQTVTLALAGSANHNGGSCQASISLDGGSSFKVLYSWIGGCPPPGESSWSFPLPLDLPAGEAVFAWSWFNQVGNREMYMNCAVVDVLATAPPGLGSSSSSSSSYRRGFVGIMGGGGESHIAADHAPDRAAALAGRPDMFVANVNNGFCTYEGKDLEFPDPGPNVSRRSDKGTAAPGQGACLAGGGSPPPPPPPPPPASPPSGGNGASPSSSSSAAAPSEIRNSPVPYQPPPPAPSNPQRPSSASSAPAVATSQAPFAPGACPSPAPRPSTQHQQQPQPQSSTTPATHLSPPSASPSGSGSGNGNGSAAPGSPCQGEGLWNCIDDGTRFQRCASGVWSVPIPMAPGTSCKPGVSEHFIMYRRDRLARHRAHGRRHFHS
ncbi:hypothetical protein ESCO_001676 [Escovopsis weberi]|uniref:Extracellular protein n=1 Tax=Escovopsis weberi TaxID=150374 RepID=A0A0M8N879_ESCWE|nr:hypothetical protein ESCO_001676 [Escovopsis weberi]